MFVESYYSGLPSDNRWYIKIKWFSTSSNSLAGTTIIEISRKNVEEEKPLSPVTTSELWEEN